MDYEEIIKDKMYDIATTPYNDKVFKLALAGALGLGLVATLAKRKAIQAASILEEDIAKNRKGTSHIKWVNTKKMTGTPAGATCAGLSPVISGGEE